MSPGQQEVAKFAKLDYLKSGSGVMAVGCTGWRLGLAYADSLYCPSIIGRVESSGGPLLNQFVGVVGVIHYGDSHRIKAIPIDEEFKCLERFEKHGEQLACA